MIRFQCPHCKTVLQSAISMAGAIVTCGNCQARLRVPSQESAPLPPLPAPSPTRSRYFWPVLAGVFLISFAGTAAVSLLLPLGKKAPELVAEGPKEEVPQDTDTKGSKSSDADSPPPKANPTGPTLVRTEPTEYRGEPTTTPGSSPGNSSGHTPTKTVPPPTQPVVSEIRTLPREETPTVVVAAPKDKEPGTTPPTRSPTNPKRNSRPPLLTSRASNERSTVSMRPASPPRHRR